MLVTILTFFAGAGVGFVVAKLFLRSRQRILENDLLRCQSIINNFTLSNSVTDDSDLLSFSGEYNTMQISDNTVRQMAADASSDDNLVDRVRSITETHISEEHFGVDQLCKELCISRMQLNRKLKKLINMSPNQLILDIRMKYAASLLVDGKLNINEVAFRLGFSSHSYFSSKFKDYFGVSPKEYISGKV